MLPDIYKFLLLKHYYKITKMVNVPLQRLTCRLHKYGWKIESHDYSVLSGGCNLMVFFQFSKCALVKLMIEKYLCS